MDRCPVSLRLCLPRMRSPSPCCPDAPRSKGGPLQPRRSLQIHLVLEHELCSSDRPLGEAVSQAPRSEQPRRSSALCLKNLSVLAIPAGEAAPACPASAEPPRAEEYCGLHVHVPLKPCIRRLFPPSLEQRPREPLSAPPPLQPHPPTCLRQPPPRCERRRHQPAVICHSSPPAQPPNVVVLP